MVTTSAKEGGRTCLWIGRQSRLCAPRRSALSGVSVALSVAFSRRFHKHVSTARHQLQHQYNHDFAEPNRWTIPFVPPLRLTHALSVRSKEASEAVTVRAGLGSFRNGNSKSNWGAGGGGRAGGASRPCGEGVYHSPPRPEKHACHDGSRRDTAAEHMDDGDELMDEDGDSSMISPVEDTRRPSSNTSPLAPHEYDGRGLIRKAGGGGRTSVGWILHVVLPFTLDSF